MVLQVITPEKEQFDLPVSLPKDYLGKKVHCIFYTEDEAKNVNVPVTSRKKPGDFFGIFSPEEGEQFDKHIQKIRGEWERNAD